MTPISSPRFSKQYTCLVSGSALSACVRSTQASSTVRTRRGVSWANEESWSEVKQTTSQRPSGSLSDGNRFSNTTTS